MEQKVSFRILKFDEFFGLTMKYFQGFGPSRFLLLDFGPLVKRVGHPWVRLYYVTLGQVRLRQVWVKDNFLEFSSSMDSFHYNFDKVISLAFHRSDF